ncbi:MAG: hypothetical protein LKF87_12300 [Clostridium tyrobutyricum]|jgi:ABC-type Na+ efflux pump permease subunit|uniref:hypothetical protein n=1 Tax=Clostridium tyrobutyricum TaxID=1519 RepID=UPI00242C3EBD|nr:hypothetical protein [Clostridium tyrobutyricum]MCH4200139.1 hypothetical protein [Clostridium tyrobutyricum]MCH4259707.1 hypothetical protein [Clostridium tyrobutyricum]
MDDATSKGISLPVTIVLIVIICTIGILLFNKTKPMQKQANVGLDTMNQSLVTNNFNEYDSQTVSGASVISAINTKASSQVVIHVITKTASKDYSSASYNVTNVNDSNYIEETANFKSTLNKNENGSVVGITFTQE